MAMLIDKNVLEKEILKWLENPGGSDLLLRELSRGSGTILKPM